MQTKIYLTIVFLQILFLQNGLFAASFPQLSDSTGKVGDTFIVNVNNLILPIKNDGVIAGFSDGRLNGDRILFSAGFYLAGKIANDIWMSNNFLSGLIQDYIPGAISDHQNLSKGIFVVRKSDLPFSKSWQDWKDAVKFGAKFYDGDGDGKYNPEDRNWNGTWDENEDMPFLLGDVTTWCVFNDGLPTEQRLLSDTGPGGIEIQQTVFASANQYLRNTIFIIYSIINRGLLSDSLSDVYFSIVADPDIGNPDDDLLGCDTLLASGYVYNNGPDNELGDDPPALFISFLQGPIIFDNSNPNELYAINNFGQNYGSILFKGYKKTSISSFQILLPINDYLPIKNAIYNNMQGLDLTGELIDPCTFSAGIVIPDSICNLVNPLFVFSGDPVERKGWLNSYPDDQRILINSGPLNLIKDKPQNIIVAFTAAKKTGALNSINLTKTGVWLAREEYNSNFDLMTYESPTAVNPVNEYILHQNYPNPFNPNTKIRYELPQDGMVTIEIFDILGQKVKTLLNKFQKADRYEVEFNGSALASGIYIYRMKVNNFITGKKMVLVK